MSRLTVKSHLSDILTEKQSLIALHYLQSDT